jgi:hypothetical protein
VSREHSLELVRSIYALWERGDHRYWADPEIQYVTVGGPDRGGSLGPAAPVAESFREWLGYWSDLKAAADKYLALDHEHVLVPYQSEAPGPRSGPDQAPARAQGATLFQVRASRVTRIVQYYDRERAFAELGISPEGDA